MSHSCFSVVSCGIKPELVQDCVECNWIIADATPFVIYQANELVTASGTVEVTSTTPGLNEITVTFLIGETSINQLTLVGFQCVSFTIVGFDRITLTGDAASPLQSATGTLCLQPRFQVA